MKHGGLDEHEKIVSLLKEVDVVISVIAYTQVVDQLHIIEAINVAGNINGFLPSDFGCEEDMISVLPPFQAFLDKKKRIRRAIEAAEFPYTYHHKGVQSHKQLREQELLMEFPDCTLYHVQIDVKMINNFTKIKAQDVAALAIGLSAIQL
ncbi:hypothetical protein RJ640_020140 [Escallonia rubra]|uniref:NmrA-like domain-containing protein n=1 Tax=Escallonia rubra TaxID=112253 RepID=A0AA88UEW6_9ASTE|nr:hypothetical protein RJ640_020140 [Escallonia rubra]